jgi:SWI/SNF-related matrix-associated actin-dependent regulator of chromatin subfamily A-like protein 1
LQLKDFQIKGATFLAARTRALLADEPGVGKTPQLCTAAKLVEAQHGLVVCPDIAVAHWLRELQKWGLARPQHDFRVLEWSKAHELKEHLAERGGPSKLPMQWDVLIADESHFGKNPQARRTKAVFGTGGLGWYARRVWAASGTPAPNNAAELWPLMRAFGKTKMDQQMFTSHFCHVDDQGKVRGNRADNVQELRDILESFALRRKKKDVLPELGAIDIQDWYVKTDAAFVRANMPDHGWAYTEEGKLRAALAGKTDEEILIFLAGTDEFATLRRYNALLKAPAVYDTVKFELENGLLDKVVIYGYHPEAMKALDGAFRHSGISSTLIIGETPKESRDGLIEDWKRNGKVLIASSIIAETALDFTAAHQGIMLEMDWVPSRNTQAMLRMHRYGQDQSVTVRVAVGTPVDEIVTGVYTRKARDLAEIFD